MDLGAGDGNGRGGQGGTVGEMAEGGAGGRLDLSSNGQAPSGFHNNAGAEESEYLVWCYV